MLSLRKGEGRAPDLDPGPDPARVPGPAPGQGLAHVEVTRVDPNPGAEVAPIHPKTAPGQGVVAQDDPDHAQLTRTTMTSLMETVAILLRGLKVQGLDQDLGLALGLVLEAPKTRLNKKTGKKQYTTFFSLFQLKNLQ